MLIFLVYKMVLSSVYTTYGLVKLAQKLGQPRTNCNKISVSGFLFEISRRNDGEKSTTLPGERAGHFVTPWAIRSVNLLRNLNRLQQYD